MDDLSVVEKINENHNKEIIDRKQMISELKQKLDNNETSKESYDKEKQDLVDRIIELLSMISGNEEVIEKIKKGDDLSANDNALINVCRRSIKC